MKHIKTKKMYKNYSEPPWTLSPYINHKYMAGYVIEKCYPIETCMWQFRIRVDGFDIGWTPRKQQRSLALCSGVF